MEDILGVFVLQMDKLRLNKVENAVHEYPGSSNWCWNLKPSFLTLDQKSLEAIRRGVEEDNTRDRDALNS